MSVPDPSEFDDSGILKELSSHDRDEFTEEFEAIYSEIDREKVESYLKNSVVQSAREKVETIQSLVGGFHPRMSARGNGGSEFEFEFLSPLSEIGEDGGDILLARADYRSLHIAIVAVEIGGENKQEWVRRINEIGNLFQQPNIRERILEQLGSTSLSLGTIQFVTLAREVDLAEFEFPRISHLVNVDNYAVWERNRDEQTFLHKGGQIAHQDLTSALGNGLNYGGVNAPSIKYLVDSHPLLPLEELVFNLIFQHRSDNNDHPQEFETTEFRDMYESMLEVGAKNGEYNELIDKEVNRILDFGVDIGMLEDDQDELDTRRDYDIKFNGEKPPKAKDAVEEKFLKYEAPREQGQRAFHMAQESFEPADTDLDDFL